MRQELERFSLAGLVGRTSGRHVLKVAIIDGPVDGSHPDLRAATITQLGASSASCRATASLACTHGTFIAGILVAGRSSMAPALCPDCSLLVRPIFCEALDFNQCPVVNEDDLAVALMAVIDAGARIVNLSLGLARGTGPGVKRLYRVYDRARDLGVLLVGASGNQRQQQVNPLFAHPWIIPVAAADRWGRVDPNSNLGDFVSRQGLLAPGVEVLSLAAGGGTRRMSGSSCAAPFVTGALALLWSLYPQATAEQLRRAILRPDAARISEPPLLDGEVSRRALAGITGVEKGELAPMSQMIATSETPRTDGIGEEASKLEPAQLPTSGGCRCSAPTQPPSFIYAVGVLRPTFPNLSVEKEFLKAAAVVGISPPEGYYEVFSYESNRFLYIAQKMCWLLQIGGVDTYYLQPRSSDELKAMIDCLGAGAQPPVTVVLGRRGPVAPPSVCGLELPVVLEQQIYPFDVDQMMADLKAEHGVDPHAIAGILRSLEIKPNAGASAGDRALNYLGFRYYQLYLKADAMHRGQVTGGGQSPASASDLYLRQVRTESDGEHPGRQVVNIIFEFQDKRTGEQFFYFCSVDVTQLFPFVTHPLRTYTTE